MITTMQLIAKQTVGAGGAASVTFSSIPQSYTDLKIVMSARATRTGTDISTTAGVTFNGDNGSYYSDKMIEGGYGSTRSASDSGTRLERFDLNSDDTTANTFSNSEMYIPNYRSTNPKSTSYETVIENNSTANYMYLAAGLYDPPSDIAITSITLTALYSSTFQEFSTFYLYGISNSTTTQATSVPYASGGDVITTDGTYWYHTFLYSGTFTPLKALTCDYLVVAGGGGGSTNEAGGGGAGGLRSTVTATGGGGSLESALSLTAQAYTVTVGAGGAAAGGNGYQGSSSVFSTITSVGGGGGGNGGVAGTSGGSGGGGGAYGSNAGGARTTNQGFAGGNGSPINGGAGGGGGAGAVGANGTATTAGNGGAGVAVSISGSSVTYGGGGGGGAFTGSTQSTGGAGGGGAGGAGTPTTGTAGTANTGGGGGGGGTGGTINGGAGGSGIIIVRYAV